MRWWQWAVPLAIGAGSQLYREWRKNRTAPALFVATDDPQMVEAMARAQAALPEFVRALDDPQSGHRDFAVKAFFPDIHEHIWVSGVTHANGVFSGTLGNDPIAKTPMRFGDPITVPGDRVTDWKYVQHDVLIGGYTIRVLRDRLSDEARRKLDAQMDFRIV